MNRLIVEIKQISGEIKTTTVSLFAIMIPMIVLIKIADDLGGVTLLSSLLEPIMASLGLPSSMALVWATTMLTNIYAGIVVFIDSGATLSVAQVTVLSSLLLICHSLPLEGIISKKAGVPMWVSIILRVAGGFVFAWLQNMYYRYSGTGEQAAKILWQSEPRVYESYLDWGIGQLINLGSIFVVICVLITGLRILKLLGVEYAMALLMAPLLKLLRVSKEAANLAVIGITLGLSYGGGLIINQSKNGNLTARDAMITVMLLNLLHSIIEDTALVLLLGADVTMVLWFRIVFSILVMAIISQFYRMPKPDLKYASSSNK
ncbi:hypothetical protein ACWU4D_02560 [Vibrio sp. WJH972]